MSYGHDFDTLMKICQMRSGPQILQKYKNLL